MARKFTTSELMDEFLEVLRGMGAEVEAVAYQAFGKKFAELHGQVLDAQYLAKMFDIKKASDVFIYKFEDKVKVTKLSSGEFTMKLIRGIFSFERFL